MFRSIGIGDEGAAWTGGSVSKVCSENVPWLALMIISSLSETDLRNASCS